MASQFRPLKSRYRYSFRTVCQICPKACIWSGEGVTVGVGVEVGVAVGVSVGVEVGVADAVGLGEGVRVGVEEGVGLAVGVSGAPRRAVI